MSLLNSRSALLATAALAFSMQPAVGGAEMLSMDFRSDRHDIPEPTGTYRSGGYGRSRTRNGHRPAGSKLARKAAQGKVGLSTIR